MNYKSCRKCLQELPLYEFYFYRGKFASRCKDCLRSVAKIRSKLKLRKSGVPDQFRLTKDIFVERSIAAHIESYDYTNTVISGSVGVAEIVCNLGHEFKQNINDHMRGASCPYCNHTRMNTESFKTSASLIHSGYDYTKVDYIKSNQKVDIICSAGHQFKQTPNQHLSGAGCTKCATIRNSNKLLKTKEQFIADSLRYHEGFDYSLTDYTGNKNKIVLTCPNGHNFKQRADHHSSGVGCPFCQPSGYQQGNSGSIYVLLGCDIVKIGITNRDVSTRCREISRSSGVNFEIFFQQIFTDGSIPYKIEAAVLKELRKVYKNPASVFDGCTECFIGADAIGTVHIIHKHIQ